jgi:hypothetical protein
MNQNCPSGPTDMLARMHAIHLRSTWMYLCATCLLYTAAGQPFVILSWGVNMGNVGPSLRQGESQCQINVYFVYVCESIILLAPTWMQTQELQCSALLEKATEAAAPTATSRCNERGCLIVVDG